MTVAVHLGELLINQKQILNLLRRTVNAIILKTISRCWLSIAVVRKILVQHSAILMTKSLSILQYFYLEK
jgi:hypothetical protein